MSGRYLSAFALGMILALLLGNDSSASSRVMLKPVAGATANLLVDTGFERDTSWRPFGEGYTRDTSVRRSGEFSIRCESKSMQSTTGAVQEIMLNQKTACPIRASGYSRAEGALNGRELDYSLYVDIEYDDHTWLYTSIAPFSPGTHGWQYAELSINPLRPIRRVVMYALFRNRIGKVWFDDLQLYELKAPQGLVLFDGAVVEKPKATPASVRSNPKSTGPKEFQTADGLSLTMAEDGSLAGGSAGTMPIRPGGGFYLRDVAAGSAFCGLSSATWAQGVAKPPSIHDESLKGEIPELGVRLSARIQALADRITISGTVTDLQKRDRAITVGFALPIPADGCQWGRDLYRTEAVGSSQEYTDTAPCRAGAVGAMSMYPWGCLSKGANSLALAIPMDEPRVYRIGYNAGAELYTIAFDLGLAPDGPKPGEAGFSLVIFRATGESGFRAVARKYYDLYPQFFVKRVSNEGLWMPFTDISTVPKPEDFGFAFHEGDGNVAWDCAHGICAFRYTEPMSYWLPMDKSLPRTREEVMGLLKKHMDSGNEDQKQWAMATKLCEIQQSDGETYFAVQNTPWCDGAMFVMNCEPGIPETSELKVNRAHLAWNPQIMDKLYGPKVSPQLAGEYLDSLEMAADMLNYRREHFRYASAPLTFDTTTRRVAIMQVFSTYGFTRQISKDLRERGKLLMANAALGRFSFMAHLLDVMGTETDWLAGGSYHPMSDSSMAFRRTLCYQKPYLFLQNTDFNRFGSDLVEKYFQRCLFFGMYPGFFSQNASNNPYFETPALYERDRPLFKRYIPVIKKVAMAGWEPITYAKASDPALKVERFGPGSDGKLYFTVRNDSEKAVSSSLRLDPALKLRPESAEKLPLGEKLSISSSGEMSFSLSPGEVAAIQVDARPQSK